MNYSAVINQAVSFISNSYETRKKLAESLAGLRNKNLLEFNSSDLQEEKFIFPVASKPLNCKVAGSDSGFVAKNLHSVDLVLVRAVGAMLEYKQNKLISSKYLPNFYSLPMPHLNTGSLDSDELESSRSLIRLSEELSIAGQLIKQFKPEYCFLDGSIIPQYMDKPRANGVASERYHKLLDQFQSLYELSSDSNCKLIGCVEDSRGSRFRTILQEEIYPKKKLSVQKNSMVCMIHPF